MSYMKDATGRRLDTITVPADIEVVPRKHRHAARLDVLPFQVSGASRYNGTSYNQASTATDGSDLYAAAYDTAGHLIIAKRTLPIGSWATFDLFTLTGNPLVLPVDTDSHNVASIFIDKQGYIHVAANMHGDQLRYVRSTNPRDITAWTSFATGGGMTGTNETQVTYPRWNQWSDGTVAFHFRDGASGNGDCWLNVYNPVTKTFTQRPMIAAGKVNNENPYEAHVVIDRADRLWLAYTWRPNGGDYNANADVHLIYSDDKGVTFKALGGTAVPLPLVHTNTTAKIFATAATGSGIINQFGLDVDTAGNPHIALMLADGTTPDRNIHHLWWDGTAWHNDQVTNLRNGFGYDQMPTRPVMVCTNSGRSLIAYSSPRWGTTIGTFRMVDVTPVGTAAGSPIDFPIAEIDGRDFELSVDDRALRERNHFRTLISSANGEQLSVGPEYNALDNWSRHFAGVLSIDLELLSELVQGKARLPRIEVIGTVTVAENTTTTATTLQVLTGGGAFCTPRETRGRTVFTQLSVRGKVSAAGTLTVAMREVQQSGSQRNFGSITFTSTSTELKCGPWLPLQYVPTGPTTDTFIDPLAQVTAGVTGTISALSLRVGILSGPIFY